jgi:addiction module HigA family antidote
MQNPPHPGDFIRTEIIEALDLNVTAAAKIIGVARSTLSNLLNEHADLTPEMGLRIEKAFGPKMDTLMRMQTAYNIAVARKKEGKIRVKRYEVPVLRAS